MGVLILAPHPDDESLGCAGVIQQALAKGLRVHVIFITSGDGFPSAAAALRGKAREALVADDFDALSRGRQTEALRALGELGLGKEEATFLGYPDGGLAAMYEARERAFVHPHTGRSETYGLLEPAYHQRAHARAAPYRYDSLTGDLEELLRELRPLDIYAPHPLDTHGDHRAAALFLRDAQLAARNAAGVHGYLHHAGKGWPWPSGLKPDQPFARREYEGKVVPEGVPWPPPERLPLTPEQRTVKRRALEAHATQLSIGPHYREYLESFLKCEEVFWPGLNDSPGAPATPP